MNNTAATSLVDGAVFVSPAVVASIVALVGVLIGLVARDIVMVVYLARKKRADELADKKAVKTQEHHDLVRLYADPLMQAAISLKYRLAEIIEKKQARFLLADAPSTSFLDYKRISTLYRIAALLGWIRAVRRERSYLDPDQAWHSTEMQSIEQLEKALADGNHVELQRLDELSILWRIGSLDDAVKVEVANLIDGERAESLAAKGALAPRALPLSDQAKLAELCADIVRSHASVEIPPELVAATIPQATLIFGIKEAYIYRDWQSAIGDMMLTPESKGLRHFSVLGFGEFEDLYLKAAGRPKRDGAHRWFDRLQTIVHDLDMRQDGMFDARRDQLRKLYQCCGDLVAALEERAKARNAISEN